MILIETHQKIISLRSLKMFILTEMKDIIRIEPDRFKFKMEKEVVHQLNSKYANKVCY